MQSISLQAPAFLFLLLLPFLIASASGETFNHDDQHCHDVSVWGEVEYADEECEKCETEFERVSYFESLLFLLCP